jgi:hypothetical protein
MSANSKSFEKLNKSLACEISNKQSAEIQEVPRLERTDQEH